MAQLHHPVMQRAWGWDWRGGTGAAATAAARVAAAAGAAAGREAGAAMSALRHMMTLRGWVGIPGGCSGEPDEGRREVWAARGTKKRDREVP